MIVRANEMSSCSSSRLRAFSMGTVSPFSAASVPWRSCSIVWGSPRIAAVSLLSSSSNSTRSLQAHTDIAMLWITSRVCSRWIIAPVSPTGRAHSIPPLSCPSRCSMIFRCSSTISRASIHLLLSYSLRTRQLTRVRSCALLFLAQLLQKESDLRECAQDSTRVVLAIVFGETPQVLIWPLGRIILRVKVGSSEEGITYTPVGKYALHQFDPTVGDLL